MTHEETATRIVERFHVPGSHALRELMITEITEALRAAETNAFDKAEREMESLRSRLNAIKGGVW